MTVQEKIKNLNQFQFHRKFLNVYTVWTKLLFRDVCWCRNWCVLKKEPEQFPLENVQRDAEDTLLENKPCSDIRGDSKESERMRKKEKERTRQKISPIRRCAKIQSNCTVPPGPCRHRGCSCDNSAFMNLRNICYEPRTEGGKAARPGK